MRVLGCLISPKYLLDLNNCKQFPFCLWMWRFPAMYCIVLFFKTYEQSERCNFKTISSISSCIRIFSASLPAIGSGKKPSLKCRFFYMAFSNILAQTLAQTLLLSEYHSNKTNRYCWWNKHRVQAINTEYTGTLLENYINQTKPIVSLQETAPWSATNQ